MSHRSGLPINLRQTTSAIVLTLLAPAFALAIDNPYANGARAELAQDYATALDQYALAAAAGLTDAMFALGRLHDEVYGNDAEALHWYQQAAQQGNTFAQVALGRIYRDGNSAADADPRLASYWLDSAATQGRSGEAAFALFELDPNSDSAARWLIQAAEAGIPEAMSRLATAYAAGDYGLPVDPAKGAEWLGRIGAMRE